MTALFADTFYWIALTDLADGADRRAMALTAERADSLIVTTDEVLAEFLTFLAMSPEQMRRQAVANVARILEDPGVRVVPQSRQSLLNGMALYGSRPDKGYSLVDCVSMQTMREQQIAISNRKASGPSFGPPDLDSSTQFPLGQSRRSAMIGSTDIARRTGT